MSAAYWAPWPVPGDIVDCLFPEEVGIPGPKERPALVLQVEEAADGPKGCVVVVAYATSQKTSRVYAGEFVIVANTVTGLTKDTKFDLVHRHALPFNADWFAAAPKSNPGHPKRGRLDLQDTVTKKKLHSAILEAEQLRRDFDVSD